MFSAIFPRLRIYLFSAAMATSGLSAEEQVLARSTCVSDAKGTTYFLTQSTVDFKDQSGDTIRIIVFRIERTDDSLAGARHLIWQDETRYYPSAPPWPFWRANLVCGSDSRGVYAILVYNRSIVEVAVDLFFLPVAAPSISALPLKSPTNTPHVPKLRIEALTRYAGMLPLASNGLKSVEATLEEGQLKIALALVNQKVDPVRFAIDLKTKEIRRIPEDSATQRKDPP